ncbi:uncharacterized protein LOC124369375 [Homalodisca vitripennis]|uniref:uncharacterized protein LOC124369375 n=1 Tax=Homalodisca vitripennis TaxID=197043 RepID=UPI001EEB345A|nr:uncharacterized protein LOC124369375 [Homalodisca vitripennis]
MWGEHKEQSGQPQKPSYKQAVSGIRVGVLHSNFPETLLTTEQMEKIQSFILEAIVEEQEGPYSPRFYGINRRQVVLIFTCENTETAEWLKGMQDSLKPWEGASLKIVPEEEITRARIATVYLPDSIHETTDKIMKFLEDKIKSYLSENGMFCVGAMRGSLFYSPWQSTALQRTNLRRRVHGSATSLEKFSLD